MLIRCASILLVLGLAVGCDDNPDVDAGLDAALADAASGDAGDVDAGPAEPDWSCLGTITPATPSGATLAWFAHVRELATDVDASGVTIRACARDDDDCATVLAEATTDRLGTAMLSLPAGSAGFDGYFEIEGGGYVPSIAIATPPITEDNTAETPAEGFALRPSELDLFATMVGTSIDATRGQIVVGVFDCASGTPNEGATIRTGGQDDSSVLFYTSAEGTADATLTATTASGAGGVFNVIPGRVGVRVNHPSGYVGGVDDALVRAGHLTGLFVGPSNDYGRWECLGSVPARPLPMGATATFIGRAIDALSGEPLAGAAYRVCARTDVDCATPIAEGVTDAMGEATEMVPLGATGFDGYVEVTLAGYLDAIGFIHPPIVADAVSPGVLALVTPAALDTVATVARATLDSTRGHLAVVAQDCGGFNSTDVGAAVAASSADAMTTAFYLDAAVPALGATSTFVGGGAGFFNLPPGATTITTEEEATSTPAASADIFIRAGWLHTLVLPPDPT